MNAADRLQFAPPSSEGLLRSVGLAICAHALLLAALTWGVNWRHGESVSFEAELWSSLPEQAAAPLVETPEPPPEKVRERPPQVSNADITLARERERKALEKQSEEKKRKELEARKLDQAKQLEAAKLREKMRQENLKRMAGLAGATGAPTATGNALRSAGPSASYAGRIRARIKPNIVFTEDVVGNPVAEVEVRTSPDGTIVGNKLLKSSGNRAWDDAVLSAVTKTEVLPRDVDGTVPSNLVISFRPKD